MTPKVSWYFYFPIRKKEYRNESKNKEDNEKLIAMGEGEILLEHITKTPRNMIPLINIFRGLGSNQEAVLMCIDVVLLVAENIPV